MYHLLLCAYIVSTLSSITIHSMEMTSAKKEDHDDQRDHSISLQDDNISSLSAVAARSRASRGENHQTSPFYSLHIPDGYGLPPEQNRPDSPPRKQTVQSPKSPLVTSSSSASAQPSLENTTDTLLRAFESSRITIPVTKQQLIADYRKKHEKKEPVSEIVQQERLFMLISAQYSSRNKQNEAVQSRLQAQNHRLRNNLCLFVGSTAVLGAGCVAFMVLFFNAPC